MEKRKILSVVVSLILAAVLFLGAFSDTYTNSDPAALAETSVESTEETTDVTETADASEVSDSGEDEADNKDTEEEESLNDVLQTTTAAASKNVVNQNVSTKSVSTNASDGSLPTGTTKLTGNTAYYFNIQVSSDLKFKKAVLYIKDSGSSSYKAAYTYTASNYALYEQKIHGCE